MLDPNKANLNLLIVFDILMREQNLTKTGQLLGLSQPAISHSLKELRKMFNDDLFVKGPGGMRPTEHALRLIEPIRHALSKIETVLNIKDTFDPAISTRVFQVGMSDYASFMILPPLIARLAVLAPGVTIDVHNVNKPEKSQLLDEGDVELAIALFSKEPKRLEYRELFAEKLVCIADPNHPSLKENGLTVEKFTELPHLLISFSEDPGIVVTKALQALGLKRHVALKVRHVVPSGYVVRNSQLIAVMPERLARFLHKMTGVAVHEIPLDLIEERVMMIWHKRSDNDLGLVWLREQIELVAQERYRGKKDIDTEPYSDIDPTSVRQTVMKESEY